MVASCRQIAMAARNTPAILPKGVHDVGINDSVQICPNLEKLII